MENSEIRAVIDRAIKGRHWNDCQLAVKSNNPLKAGRHNFETLTVTCQNFKWIHLKEATLYVSETPDK